MFTTLLSFSGLQIKIQQFVLFYLSFVRLTSSEKTSNQMVCCRVSRGPFQCTTRIKKHALMFFTRGDFTSMKTVKAVRLLLLCSPAYVQNRRRRALVASLYIRHEERARTKTLETNGK